MIPLTQASTIATRRQPKLPNLKLTNPKGMYKSSSLTPLRTVAKASRKTSWADGSQTVKLRENKLKEGLKFLEDIGYSDPARSVSSRRSVSYADFLGKTEAQRLIRKLGFIDAIPIYNKLHTGPRRLNLPPLSYPAAPSVMDKIAMMKASQTSRSRKLKIPLEVLTSLRRQNSDTVVLAKISNKKSLDGLLQKLVQFKQTYEQPEETHYKKTSPRLTEKELRSIKALDMRLK